MATLFGLIERAGLVPVEAGRVVLPNFRFPVLTGTDFDSAPIENPLFAMKLRLNCRKQRCFISRFLVAKTAGLDCFLSKARWQILS